MKALNLILLAITGALVLSSAVSVASTLLIGGAIGQGISMGLAFLIGFNARAVAEKVLGYTLKEALEEKKSE